MKVPPTTSARPGILAQGFGELGRKLRRAKIRRAMATNRREQTDQLEKIGERAWSAELDIPDAGDLRTKLAEVENEQAGVVSQQASIDEEKKQLEQEKADALAGFGERREELTQERQQRRQRLKAAAEDEKARLESAVAELDKKLAELARERKEALAPIDKRLSATRTAGAGARKEGTALVRTKADLFTALGQTIVDSGVTDPAVDDHLARLEELETGHADMKEGLGGLQTVSDAIAPGVMVKFYGLGAAVLILPILSLGIVWWFALSDRPSPASRPSRDVAATADREGRQRTEESRASQSTVSAEEVDELMQALEADDPDARVEAGRALGEAGTAAVPALIALLEDGNEEARADAAYALAEMDELPRNAASEALSGLIRALDDESWRVRANAAVALGNLGKGSSEAWEPLAAAVGDADPRVRGAAAYALAEIGVRSPDSIPILAKRLGEDEVPDVRVLAANGLAMVNTPQAVPALVMALEDENWEVQYASFRALGALKGNAVEALPALIDLLPRLEPWNAAMVAYSVKLIVEEAGPPYRPSRDLVEALEQRIGIIVRSLSLGGPREGTPMAVALPTIVGWAPAVKSRLTVELTPVLWESGGEGARYMAELVLPTLLVVAQVERQSTAALIDGLEDSDRDVRWAAAAALGAMQAEPAVPALIRVLDDDDPAVQRTAALSLVHLGSAAHAALVAALRSESPSVRLHAAYALAEVGRDADNDTVVAALNSALQDDEFIVREAVACALKNIQRITDCDPDALSGLRGR